MENLGILCKNMPQIIVMYLAIFMKNACHRFYNFRKELEKTKYPFSQDMTEALTIWYSQNVDQIYFLDS